MGTGTCLTISKQAAVEKLADREVTCLAFRAQTWGQGFV